MKPKREQPIASIQIYRPHEMTKEQRRQIAQWMREQAKALLKEGDNYATRFRAAFYWN